MIVQRRLANGMSLLLKEDSRSELVAVQAWVGVGSLYEQSDERGMSHLLEHMLFKGTDRRAVGEIAKTVEACGGDINAYTTFDRTVYYLTLMRDHAKLGADLLCDAVFHSSFDPEELEREKEVVIEEIRRSLDQPGSLVGNKIFEHCFAGCEAGRPIIGYEKEVQAFTREKIVSFYRHWYRPENVSFVAVGDFDADVFGPYLEDLLGKIPKSTTSLSHPPTSRQFPNQLEVTIIRGDYKKPRIEITFNAPGGDDEEAVALDLAAYALGSGDASRLTRVLRDQEQYVSAIGASCYSPNFGGIFSISAFPTEVTILETISSAMRITATMRNSEPVTNEELSRARANIKQDRIYQEETVDGQARNLGYGLTTKFGYRFEEVYERIVDELSAHDISEAMNHWLDFKRASLVVLCHPSIAISEDDLRKAYAEGIRKAEQSANATPLSLSLAHQTNSNHIAKDQMSGLSFVYRHLPNTKFLSMAFCADGGSRAESDKDAGRFNAYANLVARATKSLDYEEMLHFVEGRGVSLSGFSGKDSFGLKFQCLTAQTEELLPLVIESWLEPVFPEEQWHAHILETREQIKSQADSPGKIVTRHFYESLYRDHPYRLPVYGNDEFLQSADEHTLQKSYQSAVIGTPWVISAVGSMPPEEFFQKMHKLLRGKSFATKKSNLCKPIDPNQPPAKKRDHVEKDREQTHIIIGGLGLTWNDPDRFALDVIGNVLGGQGGRLFLRLRDQESLAYTVSPMQSFGVHAGIVGAYIACAPSKAEYAEKRLYEELAAMCAETLSSEELDRAKNFAIGSHAIELQHSDSQALTMALMENFSLGADDFLSYSARVKEVTASDVQRVSRRLFDPTRFVSVTVGKMDVK